MDTEIVSRETIKPSSPTPSHLRIFNLSHLDQLSFPVYVPFVFFYPMISSDSNFNDVNQMLDKLKLSLSETLSIFYPLAGRAKDYNSIDCNDEGVLFFEAKVNCRLFEFLKQPKVELLDLFLPCLDISTERLNVEVHVAIQVNIFTCGGISIGFRFLHRIIDATTMMAFLRCWAAIESGSEATTSIDVTAASHFPPRNSMDDHVIYFSNPMWMLKKEKGIQQIFVFDAATISVLKAKVASEGVPDPTRFQVVASFIWKCAMSASRALGSQNPSTMLIPVNLRPKMVPPMSENSVGNIFWQAMAHHRAEEVGLLSAVDIIRGALQKINGDLITSLQGDRGFVVVNRAIEELREMYSNETPDVYICSSMCGLGLQDVDFGWGKPIWIAYAAEGHVSNKLYLNTIILMDTMSGDGVEASVLLAENHMEKLQGDKEFLAFATLKTPTLKRMRALL